MTAPTTAPPIPPPVQPPVPPRPPGSPAGELTSAQWSMTVTPVVAAVTTLCASLALAGVIDGLRWWGYAGVAVTVVTAVGLGLRAVRAPILMVGLSQIFALLCLLVALFTDSGILGLFPGPTALADLGDVLRTSIEVVRTGVPPVVATPPVLCLVVIAIGLVAVLVDTLAVSAGTPAACGLVLLCVYAVPASLADEMLPWWAFVLGAVSFAALLAVDGAHRHQQWRNRPTVQGTSGGVGSPTALVSGAVAIALFAGATVTVIGTVGQLPGGEGKGASGGLGLNPFTQLRGMLDQDGNVELFRVRNLGEDPRYLRALTLAEYDRNGGWRGPDTLPSGHSADDPLPPPVGQRTFGGAETVEIEIEPVNSRDTWAPVYGTPVRLRDLPAGMRYDNVGGMVYGDHEQTLPTYVEEADLSQPSTEELRSARPAVPGDVDERYLVNDDIDRAVVRLANDLTRGRGSTYDKVTAIQDYFKPSNGFVYDTQTATGSSEDALEDFLFRSKSGFCEQYASSLAILLRAANIPSRVAMGYTAGFESGDYRSISTQNAHAWVEVFFPGYGWTEFDSTPLSDGTTYTPPYASESGPSGPEDDPEGATEQQPASSVPAGPTNNPEEQQESQAGAGVAGQGDGGVPGWIMWMIVGLVGVSIVATGLAFARRRQRFLVPLAAVAWTLSAVFLTGLVSWWLAALVVVLLVAAAPGLVRERLRLRRRHDVHTNGPAAATSAWAELLAESTDRGAEASNSTETVRTAARRLAHEHELDDEGKQALRTVVTEVERSWYGGDPAPDPSLAPAFDTLITGLRRTDPLGWRAKILPRSIFRAH